MKIDSVELDTCRRDLLGYVRQAYDAWDKLGRDQDEEPELTTGKLAGLAVDGPRERVHRWRFKLGLPLHADKALVWAMLRAAFRGLFAEGELQAYLVSSRNGLPCPAYFPGLFFDGAGHPGPDAIDALLGRCYRAGDAGDSYVEIVGRADSPGHVLVRRMTRVNDHPAVTACPAADVVRCLARREVWQPYWDHGGLLRSAPPE